MLRFSYIWKNKQLKTENEALRQHRKVSHAHARQNKTLGAPSLGKIRGRSESSASDDEVSLFGVPPARVQCAACSTRISDVWWRCPRSLQGKAMCETCGFVKFAFPMPELREQIELAEIRSNLIREGRG